MILRNLRSIHSWKICSCIQKEKTLTVKTNIFLVLHSIIEFGISRNLEI